MVEAGLAEMHLRVDDAGQDVQAAAVDGPRGRGAGKVADGGDPAAEHADVALRASVLVHDDPALEDQVEGLGHDCFLKPAGPGGRPIASPRRP